MLGSTQVILELSDTLLFVNEGDPAPSPVARYTDVAKVFTADGNDYYIQSFIKDGAFIPV